MGHEQRRGRVAHHRRAGALVKEEEKEERPRYWGDKTIVNGKLINCSPSQTKTFSLCAMRWYQEKKMGRAKKPAGKGAKLGGECHKRTEVYLLTGADVRGPIERVGAENLAKYIWAAPFMKGPGVVEGALINPIIATPGGVLMSGFIDFKIPGAPDREPHVLDHKFRKDVAKYAETEEELRDDPQAVVYGAHTLMEEPQASGVTFTHLNVQTEGTRFAKEVSTRFTRDEVFAKFAAQAKVIDGAMQSVAAMESIDTVPYASTEACRAFGGCDFINVCPKSPAARARAAWLKGSAPEATSNLRYPTSKYESINPMGLIGASVATPAAPAAVATPPAVGPKVVAASACEMNKVYMVGGKMGRFAGAVGNRLIFRREDSTLAEIAGTELAEDLTGTIAEELFTGSGGKPAGAAVTEKKRLVAVDVVSPPAVAAVTPPTAPVVAPVVVVASIVPPGEGVSTDPNAAATPAAAAASVTATLTPESATAASGEVKAKRGRKPKGQVEAGAAAEGIDSDDESGLFLLVDCISSKPTVDLAPYVAALAAEICKREGIPELRLAPKTSDASYSGWKGLLSIEALKNPPIGLCSIATSELTEPVIEALSAVARVVVRGRR